MLLPIASEPSWSHIPCPDSRIELGLEAAEFQSLTLSLHALHDNPQFASLSKYNISHANFFYLSFQLFYWISRFYFCFFLEKGQDRPGFWIKAKITWGYQFYKQSSNRRQRQPRRPTLLTTSRHRLKDEKTRKSTTK
jgi:hypothetical protein